MLDALFAPAPDPARVRWLGEHDYAHRGLHGGGACENSPASFAAAITRGFGIECDIRRSREGRAVVFHDATLERLAQHPDRVDALTVAQLTAARLEGGTDCIPTLRDLLEQVAGVVPLLLELKSDGKEPVTTLCRAVRRDIEGYQGPVAVMSFDARIPAWFARRAPGVIRGLVVSEEDARTLSARLRRHRLLWRAKPHFLAYDVRDLPSRFARAQRARGLPLLTWTVSSPALRERAAEHADAPIAEGAGLA